MDDFQYPTNPDEPIEEKIARMTKRILMGAPVKYNAEYHIPLMLTLFSKGDDISSFCVGAEISRKTFDNWVTNYPEFETAYEEANQMAKIFWEKYADLQADNPDFNTKLWSIKMRNRFDYTDQRKLRIKSLKHAKNAKEQMQCITEEISEGRLTGAETNQLSTFIKTGIDVDTHFEVKKDIKGIQERLGIES